MLLPNRIAGIDDAPAQPGAQGLHLATDVGEVVQVGGLAGQRVRARQQLTPGARDRRWVVPGIVEEKCSMLTCCTCAAHDARNLWVAYCCCQVSMFGLQGRTTSAGAGPTVRPLPSPGPAETPGCRTPVHKSDSQRYAAEQMPVRCATGLGR